MRKKISVIEADAKDYLSYIDDDEVFDMIFLDGPKAHYIYMLDECVRLLKKRRCAYFRQCALQGNDSGR